MGPSDARSYIAITTLLALISDAASIIVPPNCDKPLEEINLPGSISQSTSNPSGREFSYTWTFTTKHAGVGEGMGAGEHAWKGEQSGCWARGPGVEPESATLEV